MPANPRTTPMILKDGTIGRSVKVSIKNVEHVAGWCGGVYLCKEDVKVLGLAVEHKIRVHAKAGIRVAKLGDTVLKDGLGHIYVIKAENYATLVRSDG